MFQYKFTKYLIDIVTEVFILFLFQLNSTEKVYFMIGLKIDQKIVFVFANFKWEQFFVA